MAYTVVSKTTFSGFESQRQHCDNAACYVLQLAIRDDARLRGATEGLLAKRCHLSNRRERTRTALVMRKGSGSIPLFGSLAVEVLMDARYLGKVQGLDRYQTTAY